MSCNLQLKDVGEFKKSLKCPQIFEHTNPATKKPGARFCKFGDVLSFFYKTPKIVKEMVFAFQWQEKPIGLYCMYADGTKQINFVEFTNFLARNMNL